jgi:RimJ/RimL family protein N-acetyltransferase
MVIPDAPDYLAALGAADTAAEVFAHLRMAPPRDVAAAEVIIAAARATPGQLPYAQRLSSGEFVGSTSFYEMDPDLRTVAIGHTWIARRFWRTGVNTESKLIMLTRAFESLGAERLV